MDKVLSVSYGELALKGLNRGYFEDQLIKNVKRAIKDIGYNKIYKEQGKLYVEGNEENFPKMINRLRKVFGLVNISSCIRIEKNIEDIEKASIEAMKERINSKDIKTFKVETNRADKTFPIKSPDLSRQLGGVILKNFPNAAIKIGGYTDNTGDAAINKKVSDERAKRVAKELKKLGALESHIVEAVGYGSDHPISSNETENGRAQNRRVDLKVANK